MSLYTHLLNEPTPPIVREWNDRETLLYAVAVGAGAQNPADELAFTTENSQGIDQQVIPSFAAILAAARRPGELGDFDMANMVHAEQSVVFHSPIPPAGSAEAVSTLVGVYDKGKAGIMVQENVATDRATGKPLATSTSTFFIRGEGGFDGDSGPTPPPWDMPVSDPDFTVVYPTRQDQPLLYRLTGDRNPLHADPSMAQRAGFPRPILHGMCTYGFTCRALLHTIAGSDPARLLAMSARFSRPVMPGDDLTIRIWDEGNGKAKFQTYNSKGDVVLDRGTATFAAEGM